MTRRVWPLLATLLVLAVAPANAQSKPLTPKEAGSILATHPTGDAARDFAARIRATYPAEMLRTGIGRPRIQETLVLWALESPNGVPRVQHVGNIRSWGMERIEGTDLYVAVEHLPNFAVVAYQYDVNGRRFGGEALQLEYYPPHPDSIARPEVPKGKVTQMPRFHSRIFPGTSRDWWLYVPAQYNPEKPAAVMVFQDGQGYLYATTMMDNLIAQGDMPVTVGIFINPGSFENGGSNRSFEYDTLSDQYARFLRDEILPEVGKTVKLTDDPERRAVVGISSGGICAWTVAWEMPDLFRKVITHVGSFVDIAAGKTLKEGGHNYPYLIRKTPNKPIRIWMQDGSNDLDNEHGSWPLANQTMATALRWKGYDYTFLFGQGFHSMSQGQATFPDALRWIWRDVR